MTHDVASLMTQLETHITPVLIISTAIAGGILMVIYIIRCCKRQVAIEEATVVHCFLMAAGIVGGLLLAVTVSLGAVIPDLASPRHTAPEFDIYILIGAVITIVVFCKQARTHVFFPSDEKNGTVKSDVRKDREGTGNSHRPE